MSNVKNINLQFDLGQILNDVLVKCNLISSGIKDEAQADIRATIMAPDSPETRSIINRSLTEAFGNVKVACQRYLKVGRTTDNNMLERMVRNVTYIVDGEGHATNEIDTITYETVQLDLYIPNFNVSVTDALKSSIHKYVVDYIMGRFLQDQHADKAGEYASLAEGKDYQQIISNINSRERFNVRKPSWI